MLHVAEADILIKKNTPDWGSESVPLAHSLGRVLSEAVISDRDQPPFHRVAMDGFAVAQATSGVAVEIQGKQLAGETPLTLQKGKAIEIMTGAALPQNASAVVPYEKCAIEGSFVRFNEQVAAFENIHRKGADIKAGQTLIEAGTTINAASVAALATFGKAQVRVKKQPRIVFIATGNELVPVNEKPLDHQIRMSNNYMISSILHKIGLPCDLVHLADEKQALASGIEKALQQYDMLLFSGGVSMGSADFVPEVLKSSGVHEVFHKIAQKPGKPLWFGNKHTQLVFGLPGNPVSSVLCFVRYVLPLLGAKKTIQVKPARAFNLKSNLTHFVAVKLVCKNNELLAEPIENNGSGDILSLYAADGFLEIQGGAGGFNTSTSYPFHYLP